MPDERNHRQSGQHTERKGADEEQRPVARDPEPPVRGRVYGLRRCSPRVPLDDEECGRYEPDRGTRRRRPPRWPCDLVLRPHDPKGQPPERGFRGLTAAQPVEWPVLAGDSGPLTSLPIVGATGFEPVTSAV